MNTGGIGHTAEFDTGPVLLGVPPVRAVQEDQPHFARREVDPVEFKRTVSQPHDRKRLRVGVDGVRVIGDSARHRGGITTFAGRKRPRPGKPTTRVPEHPDRPGHLVGYRAENKHHAILEHPASLREVDPVR